MNLNLITYFTSGEPETRAQYTKRDKSAGSGRCYSYGFVKGFVKADVCNWQEFVTLKGWPGVRENGKLRLEGKNMLFKTETPVIFILRDQNFVKISSFTIFV